MRVGRETGRHAHSECEAHEVGIQEVPPGPLRRRRGKALVEFPKAKYQLSEFQIAVANRSPSARRSHAWGFHAAFHQHWQRVVHSFAQAVVKIVTEPPLVASRYVTRYLTPQRNNRAETRPRSPRTA